MIYDCFSYWDEDLLLDLRLNILDKHIDFFVIVEGTKTWQNNPKPLRFDIKKFQRFKNKIIYIPITDMRLRDLSKRTLNNLLRTLKMSLWLRAPSTKK